MGKLRRQKQNKKSMAVYSQAFGFRQPFQVIIDGNFLHVAILGNKNLDELLSMYLGGPVKLMTTYCTYAELKKIGPEMRNTAKEAKKLEKRRCAHNPAVSAAECIKEVIGKTNKDNYCVATQDKDLRIFLREIPGTPLIYINNSVTILEPISQATHKKVEEIELKKLKPRDFESVPKNQSEGKVHKKRKVKGPNPLSIKKKTKVSGPLPAVSNENTGKRKRIRKRKSGQAEIS